LPVFNPGVSPGINTSFGNLNLSGLVIGSTTYTQLSAGTLSANYVNIGVAGGLQGLGVLTEVGRTIVTTATNSVAFNGLNILSDNLYQFAASIYAIGSPANNLYVNGLTTNSNYGFLQISFVASAVTPTAGNGAGSFITGGLTSGQTASVTGTVLRDPAGFTHVTANVQEFTGGTVPASTNFAMTTIQSIKWSSLTNITGIQFQASVASGFGTSSVFVLYKVTAG